MDAAAQLAARHGYRSVTTDMIAETANVAKGTVFAHFGDRSHLLAALGIRRMDGIVTDIAFTEADPVSRIVEIYHPLLSFFVDTPDFARLFIDQSALPDGPMSAAFAQSCHQLEEVVARELRKVAQDGDEQTLLTNGAQAFFLQIVTYRLGGWIKTDDEALARLRTALDRWINGPAR
nr:TetR/AcrR family transcriptional regulator [Thalassococcus sp. S3]